MSKYKVQMEFDDEPAYIVPEDDEEREVVVIRPARTDNTPDDRLTPEQRAELAKGIARLLEEIDK